ncbi:MAG: uroporphyrinogen-III C-methyltransferase [Myxococcales bacterium]|nr:uroporphyrinogen-III C-methyltransferase [Myxococcales bacterium]
MARLVSIVSSGPGDPELLTLKAVRRLQEAEVVLHDDLSSGPILAYAEGATLISVGKRAARSSPTQLEVSRLLVTYAQRSARVVRLKSGDAGIFGRLEDELRALTEAQIPFEIIPGVTSACAAAAMLGVPLTRRLHARRVQFITGADVTGKLPVQMNWAALVDPTAVTVVYMGRRTFPILADALLKRGLPEETPAYLVEGVSGPAPRVTRSTVERLVDELGANTTQPALILYGALIEFPDSRNPVG